MQTLFFYFAGHLHNLLRFNNQLYAATVRADGEWVFPTDRTGDEDRADAVIQRIAADGLQQLGAADENARDQPIA
jgi:hypothetical protein